jgi:hypothetical protein
VILLFGFWTYAVTNISKERTLYDVEENRDSSASGKENWYQDFSS